MTAPEPPNDDPVAPVAADDSASTTTGGTVIVPVLANDTDANGDTLSVSNLSPASGGSAALSGGGTTVTYMAPSTAGTYTFTYTATDGALTSNAATVTVTVTDPPLGASTATVSYTTTGGRTAGKHVLVTVVLRDANGNPVGATSIAVSIALNGATRWTGSGTTGSNGAVSWEIKNAPSGTYSTTVTSVAGAAWTGYTDDPTFAR